MGKGFRTSNCTLPQPKFQGLANGRLIERDGSFETQSKDAFRGTTNIPEPRPASGNHHPRPSGPGRAEDPCAPLRARLVVPRPRGRCPSGGTGWVGGVLTKQARGLVRVQGEGWPRDAENKSLSHLTKKFSLQTSKRSPVPELFLTPALHAVLKKALITGKSAQPGRQRPCSESSTPRTAARLTPETGPRTAPEVPPLPVHFCLIRPVFSPSPGQPVPDLYLFLHRFQG